jgi:hypothetical protein
MSKFLATITAVGANLFLVEQVSRPTDPGFGNRPPVDPDYGMGTLPHPDQGLPGWEHPDQGLPGRPDRPDQGLPGYGHPGNRPPGSWGGRPDNSLPVPPVRPSPPIVLPPITTWPPQIPNLPDNSLPTQPGRPEQPIVIPPDFDLGIEAPIYLPTLPEGAVLLIALTGAHAPTPKDVPAGNKPAILVKRGQKPVLVYVSAVPVATPK